MIADAILALVEVCQDRILEGKDAARGQKALVRLGTD